MNTEEKIKVMQAYLDGSKIQIRVRNREQWHNFDLPTWDWVSYEYRVAPKTQWRVVNTKEMLFYYFDSLKEAQTFVKNNALMLVNIEEVEKE